MERRCCGCVGSEKRNEEPAKQQGSVHSSVIDDPRTRRPCLQGCRGQVSRRRSRSTRHRRRCSSSYMRRTRESIRALPSRPHSRHPPPRQVQKTSLVTRRCSRSYRFRRKHKDSMQKLPLQPQRPEPRSERRCLSTLVKRLTLCAFGRPSMRLSTIASRLASSTPRSRSGLSSSRERFRRATLGQRRRRLAWSRILLGARAPAPQLRFRRHQLHEPAAEVVVVRLLRRMR